MGYKTSGGIFVLAYALLSQIVFASQESTGLNGINSSGLGLTGNGVGIGQVDIFRSADPASPDGSPFDTISDRINSFIHPAEVFFTTVDPVTDTPSFTPTANAVSEINVSTGHGTVVAGVIISTDTTVVNGDTAVGVARQAKLFSTGLSVDPSQDALEISSVAAQHIAMAQD